VRCTECPLPATTGLARPATEAARRAICSDSVSYLFIFNDSCQTNYLIIYQTNLCQIFKIGTTMAADNQHEISFSIFQAMLPRPFLLVLSTELIFVTPVASGAAGRANVRLCPASSFLPQCDVRRKAACRRLVHVI